MRSLLLAGVALGWVGSAHAAFIDTALETNAGVVFTGTGSINITGLKIFGTFSGFAVYPSNAQIFVGEGNAFRGATGPVSFGGRLQDIPSSHSGDNFYLSPRYGVFGVSYNYISGATLNSTLTFDGATLTSLGLTPGTYVYNVNSGVNADTITIQIGPLATEVPEPASLALLSMGVASVALMRRRRVA